jgi:lupus La protein
MLPPEHPSLNVPTKTRTGVRTSSLLCLETYPLTPCLVHKPRFENKVKTNYDALPASSDPAEIRKQVEFYFSDSNLNYDDYMRKLTGGAANNPAPLASIHSFKRMRRFQPIGAVVAALRESATLAIVDSKGNPAPDATEDEAESKDGFCNRAYIVRRTSWVPIKENDDDVTALDDPGLPRSIYAKGFGVETATMQFDVEAYFAPFGPVNMVRLRRKIPERSFKGSAFVEFATEELAQKFLDSTERPLWAGAMELKVMSKREYLEKQEEDIKSGKISADKQSRYKMYQSKEDRFAGKRGDRNGGGGRGGRRDDRRDDRNGGDRRDGRNGRGRHNDRNGRNGRDGRDRRNGRDDDDWKGRRDDFQKSLKDDKDRCVIPNPRWPKPS